MQKLIQSIRILTGMAALLLVFACGGQTGSEASETEAMEETTEAIDKSGPEYTSAYICPMHCEGSGSEAEGKCPVCGMAYVANPEHASHEGHDHDGADHDHDDHDGHDHDH